MPLPRRREKLERWLLLSQALGVERRRARRAAQSELVHRHTARLTSIDEARWVWPHSRYPDH